MTFCASAAATCIIQRLPRDNVNESPSESKNTKKASYTQNVSWPWRQRGQAPHDVRTHAKQTNHTTEGQAALNNAHTCEQCVRVLPQNTQVIDTSAVNAAPSTSSAVDQVSRLQPTTNYLSISRMQQQHQPQQHQQPGVGISCVQAVASSSPFHLPPPRRWRHHGGSWLTGAAHPA